MIHCPFNEIDETVLQRLCDDGASESATLEFKRNLPDSRDASKRDLAEDVCALANAQGGDLLFGIEAGSNGRANGLVPITSEAEDAAIRRLCGTIEAGIEPRVRVQARAVQLPRAGGGYALLVRVERSFGGPHRVTLLKQSKFMLRSNTSSREMSYAELRDSFSRAATLQDRARAFRDERIKAIAGGFAPVSLVSQCLCVLHVLPLSTIGDLEAIDIQYEHRQQSDWIPVHPRLAVGAQRHFNLEGLLIIGQASIDHPSAKTVAYTQVYRDGCVELVGIAPSPESLDPDAAKPEIDGTTLAMFIRSNIARSIQSLDRASVSGPLVVGVALINVHNAVFNTTHLRAWGIRGRVNRAVVALPASYVPTVTSAVADVDALVRPTLDVLWQAFGTDRCPFYEGEKWQQPV